MNRESNSSLPTGWRPTARKRPFFLHSFLFFSFLFPRFYGSDHCPCQAPSNAHPWSGCGCYTASVVVKICLFASLRDVVGQSEILLDSVPPGDTARQVFRRLAKQFPGLERYGKVLLVVVNQEYSDWNQEIFPGDEIAFFPPVSGGTV